MAVRFAALSAVLAGAVLVGCGGPERVMSPNWVGSPTTPKGLEYTPEKALRHNIVGLVILRCVADAFQRPANCAVVLEEPAGWGFGPAAMRTTWDYRARDASSFAGQHVPSTGEWFYLPVMFCPPSRTTCTAELHAKVQALIDASAAVERLVRAGRCPEARAAASQISPQEEALIATRCGGRQGSAETQ